MAGKRDNVTFHLKRLRDMVTDQLNDDGDAQTRGEALADLLWKEALGWTEQIVKDDGTTVEVIHKPQKWAIELIYNRLEGREPNAQPPSDQKASVKDRVRSIAQARLNEVAMAIVGGGRKTPPPPPPVQGN